jgi:hypothetical protein
LNLRIVVLAAAFAIVGLCLYYDVATVTEFYGSGPPYYGGTTNMDKWSDPLPRLVVVNLGAAAVVATALVLARKQGGRK